MKYVLLRDIDQNDWDSFKKLCIDEKTNATAKLRKMIKDEVQKNIKPVTYIPERRIQ